MTIEEIRTMVSSAPEYDFLRTNEHIRDRLMFLTLGGSYAYGTNVETSDVDVRGCALNSCSDILGLTNFEQVLDTPTDTTVYSFNKLIGLLINCNPNTIEMLGCHPDHYFLVSPMGQEMIDNAHLFLSQRAFKSFGGYATQQLRRLENYLARHVLTQERKEEHLLASMGHAQENIEKKYIDTAEGQIELYIDDSPRDDLAVEIFANIHLNHLSARNFNSMINEFKNVLETYDKVGKRNKKKDDTHLNKHAMHLIRLYGMCLDILEKEKIVTYRADDHDLLMSIRAGDYQKSDGTYNEAFYDMISDYEKRLDYAKNNTSLPKNPDMKKIQEFVMSVNRRAIDA